MLLTALAIFALIPSGRAQSAPPFSVPFEDKPPALSLPNAKPAVQPGGSPGVPAAAPADKAGTTPPAAPAQPVFKPSSTSGQFVIHGADLETRTRLGQMFEETSEELRRLLRDPSPWDIPIVVSIKTSADINPSDPFVRASFAHLAEGGFHLQLTLQMRGGFNTKEMRAELIRMLLAERILRGHQDITTKRPRILPDWLLVGITEGLEYRQRERPSASFALVFGSGKVYGIEEILDASPGQLDSFSRLVYNTSCCALVLTLIDQPEGGLRMGKFLSSLASDSRGDRELINHWFPGIAQSKTSLEKWWSLQMANLSRPTVFETMGPAETAKALADALTLRFTVEAGSTPLVTSKKAADSADEPAAEDEEAKPRGILSRWFSRGTSDGEKEEEKPKPEKKPEPKPLTDEELAKGKQQGFRLRNLFGGSDSDEKDAAKPEPKKADKPARKEEPEKKDPEKKKEDAPEPAKADDGKPKRPGLFTRMFSGGDKDKDEGSKDEAKKEPSAKPEAPQPAPKKPAPEAPKKEEPKTQEASKDAPKDATAIISPLGRLIAAAMFPQAVALADAGVWLSPRTAHFTFLGFGKKKDKDAEGEKEKEDAKDDEKKSKKKEEKPEPPKKEEKKDEVKTEKKDEPETPAAKPAPPAPAPKPKPPVTKYVPASAPIEDYARVLKRSDARQVFAATLAELNVLAQHAHPLFRPVVAGYIEVVVSLADGKTKDVDARLKQLKADGAAALAKAKAVQDALDVYEANHPSGYSGMFEDFLNLEKNFEKRLPKPTDPIGIWFEEQFKKFEEQ